jgi:enoyl-CoA hydratase
MKSSVQKEIRARALVLTLDVPQRGNAFGPSLIEDLEVALAEIPAAECDTVIFQGAGKGFCGGLDLAGLEEETDATLLTRLIRIEMLLQRIARLPQRTVALVHGFAYGAGADLALACRQRIAAPECRFAFPGVRFGIALGTGRLARLVGADLAWELLARSTPISCVEAQKFGMIGRVVPQEDWSTVIEDYAQAPCSLDQRMAAIIAERLDPKEDDADLAALVRSAALPDLRERIASYAARARTTG